MANDIDLRPYLEEHRKHGEIVLRGRWVMDGAETLEEAADLVRQFADELDALSEAGFHLMGPIEDDCGFAHRPSPSSGDHSGGNGQLHEQPTGAD